MPQPGLNEEVIKSSLRTFLTEKALPLTSKTSFGDDDSFIEAGILDSTGVLELLQFVEERFAFRVADDEIVPDNLDSLNKLVSYIGRKSVAL
jgi:acyl carrier protein